jgi:hypothetical protein
MNAPLRHPASPYARRLARERGVTLDGLPGSGPFGRIVAADVEAFVSGIVDDAKSSPIPAPAPAVAPPAVPVSALGTQIDLHAVDDLISQFSGANLELSFHALMLRSIGRVIEDLAPGATIAWEAGSGSGRRLVNVVDAAGAPFGRIRGLIEAEAAAPVPIAPTSLSVLPFLPQGVRTVMLSLLPGFSMRLAVSVLDGQADVLLCFDADKIDEHSAATLLSRMREDLEAPLRLLA